MIAAFIITMVLLAAVLIHLKTMPPTTPYHDAERVAWEIYKLFIREPWFLGASVSRTQLSEVVVVRVRLGSTTELPYVIKGIPIHIEYIDIPKT